VIQDTLKLSDTAKKLVDKSLSRIRKHPFIAAAIERKLRREQIKRWIFCAGRESRIFPAVVKNMLAICSPADQEIVSILSRNLNDELGNGNPEEAHFQHYLRLLTAMGISFDEFTSYEEKAGIKLALNLAFSVSTQDHLATAIGYLLVNEGMTPITYSAVGEALCREYAFTEVPFLAAHVDIDERHVAGLFRGVDHLDERQFDHLSYGIDLGERGMMILLDEAYGVFERK
jgi:pyrroloquinoline quinone (PQQ) biosynthesis protein C